MANDGPSLGVVSECEGLAGKSLCILVDQFEELFRYEKETSREEAELFVDLIGQMTPVELESAQEPQMSHDSSTTNLIRRYRKNK